MKAVLISLCLATLLLAAPPVSSPAPQAGTAQEVVPGQATEGIAQTAPEATREGHGKKGVNINIEGIPDADEDGEDSEQLRTVMSSPAVWMSMLIPIVAIVMGLGLAMFAMWFNFRRRRMVHEERMKAIELGRDVPEYVEPRKDPLRSGIILLSFGLGISAAIGITSGEFENAAMGAILIIPGLGYILYSFINKNNGK
jgi:hypothetical protein